jgi:hypothetical protein
MRRSIESKVENQEGGPTTIKIDISSTGLIIFPSVRLVARYYSKFALLPALCGSKTKNKKIKRR